MLSAVICASNWFENLTSPRTGIGDRAAHDRTGIAAAISTNSRHAHSPRSVVHIPQPIPPVSYKLPKRIWGLLNQVNRTRVPTDVGTRLGRQKARFRWWSCHRLELTRTRAETGKKAASAPKGGDRPKRKVGRPRAKHSDPNYVQCPSTSRRTFGPR